MTAPAEALTPPVAEAPIPDLVNNILGAKQYISTSYWLGELIDLIWGFNPWEYVAQQVAGDWNAAAEASDALSKLADFNTRYSEVIAEGAGTLIPAAWDGNAAARADVYFAGLAQSLSAQVDALQNVAGQFRTLAAGMQEMAQALQSLCQDLLDALIVVGVSAAATAAVSWTGVGSLVGGSVTAAQILQVVKLWYLILDAHDAAWAAVQAFTGICAGYLGALQGLEMQPLPAGAYDHPGV
ncbi:hypothetical protein OHA21_25070 [Actinoplanes sp. NBC_00393]|uniref:hypothetical protein n=1 Tax=Actinoplanes sp. NBC_00393 TaxID=2975953 RepID=UPI002E1D4351